MLYVFRRAASNSARDLAEAMTINCRRLNDLAKAHFGAGVRAGDTIVCWGESLAPIEGVKILNGAAITNKLADAQKLLETGVPTVEVSATRPATAAVGDPAVNAWQALMREVPHPLDRTAIQRVITSIGEALRLPIPVPATWLPRRFNHVGGADLLRPPTAPEYFSKKEDLRREYRIHCFKGNSIRAGRKVPREGMQPHAWIRSFDGGWKIMYDDFNSTKPMKQLAWKAVKALGLDFGAVDIGEKADGSLIVLEVNRAPGLEGNSIGAYAQAIRGWLEEGE